MVRSAINLSASHTRENTDPPPRARLLDPTLLLLLMPPTDFTELMLLSPMESTLSMPQSTMPSMPQFLDTLSMPQSTMLSMPQFLAMLCMLPQLTMPQSMLDMLLMTLLSLPHTPTPMLLLMTTLVLLSSRLRTTMELVLLMENTLSTFPTAESNTSSTTPMTMMVMLLMSPMRESHITLLLPQLLTLSMPQFLPTLSMPQLLLMPQLMLFLVKLNQLFQYLLQLPPKPIFIDIYR